VGSSSGPSGLGFFVQDPSGVAGASSSGLYSSFNYEINTWYHHLGVFDGNDNGKVKLFVNGNLVGEVESGYAQAKEYNVDFRLANFGSYYSIVKIPIIRIYSGKALSNEEVVQNYNAVKSRFGL
jgi:hypothetical protein